MKLNQINEHLWVTEDEQFRFELGPVKKADVATDELLATLTPAYSGTSPQNGPLRGIDADGVRIEIGKPFTYLDWGKEMCWYVYSRADDRRWVERATSASLAQAVAVALTVEGLTDAATG